MIFDQLLNTHFSSIAGAYSEITAADEAVKGQITLDDDETKLVLLFFGHEKIHIGKVSDDRNRSVKKFYFINKGQQIELPLVFPKEGKKELRLYMSKANGFYPAAGDIWFVFKSRNHTDLVVGYMTMETWELVRAGSHSSQAQVENLDPDDDVYQSTILSALAGVPIETISLIYPRNPIVAAAKIEDSKYQCEVDNTHSTFKSAVTSSNFVEVHHLIPLSKQEYFGKTLDTASNLIALCPNCHRAFHYGEDVIKASLIERFLTERRALLFGVGIEIDLSALLRFYGIQVAE